MKGAAALANMTSIALAVSSVRLAQWATLGVIGALAGAVGALGGEAVLRKWDWHAVEAVATSLAVFVALMLGVLPLWKEAADRRQKARRLRVALYGHLEVLRSQLNREYAHTRLREIRPAVRAIWALMPMAHFLEDDEYRAVMNAIPAVAKAHLPKACKDAFTLGVLAEAIGVLRQRADDLSPGEGSTRIMEGLIMEDEPQEEPGLLGRGARAVREPGQ